MSRPPGFPTDPASPSNEPGRDPASGGSEAHRDAAGALVRPRPGGVVAVSVIVAVEATALLTAAGWYGYQLLSGSPVLSFWGAVFTLSLLLAFSAWLYAVSLFLYRGYRWTRAAALVAQLFVLTIGFPTLSAGLIWAGFAMLIPAGAAIVLLFQNKVIRFASRSGSTTPML